METVFANLDISDTRILAAAAPITQFSKMVNVSAKVIGHGMMRNSYVMNLFPPAPLDPDGIKEHSHAYVQTMENI